MSVGEWCPVYCGIEKVHSSLQERWFWYRKHYFMKTRQMQKELAGPLEMRRQQAIWRRLKALEMIQEQGNWVPYKKKSSHKIAQMCSTLHAVFSRHCSLWLAFVAISNTRPGWPGHLHSYEEGYRLLESLDIYLQSSSFIEFDRDYLRSWN